MDGAQFLKQVKSDAADLDKKNLPFYAGSPLYSGNYCFVKSRVAGPV